jgi:chromosome segregation ATPase
MVTIQRPIESFNRYISDNYNFTKNLPESRVGYLDVQKSNQEIMNYFYEKYVKESYDIITKQHKTIQSIRKNCARAYDRLEHEINIKNNEISILSENLMNVKLKQIELLKKLSIVTKKLFSRYGIKSSSLISDKTTNENHDLQSVLTMIESSIDKKDIYAEGTVEYDQMKKQLIYVTQILDTLKVPEENEEILINDLIRILNITSNGELKLIGDTNLNRMYVDSTRPRLTKSNPTVYILVNDLDLYNDINHRNYFLYHRQYIFDINQPNCNLIFKVPFSYPLEDLYQIITNTSLWFINNNQIYTNIVKYNININDDLLFYEYNDIFNITNKNELLTHYNRSLKQYVLTDFNQIIIKYNAFKNIVINLIDPILDRDSFNQTLSSDNPIDFKSNEYIKVIKENNEDVYMNENEIKEALSKDSIFTNYVSGSSNVYLSNLSSNPVIYFIINIVRNHNTIRSIINFIIFLVNEDIDNTNLFALRLMDLINDCENIRNLRFTSDKVEEKVKLIHELSGNIKDLLDQHKTNKTNDSDNINKLINSLEYLLIDEYSTNLVKSHKYIDVIIEVLINKIGNIEQMIELLMNELNNFNTMNELNIILSNKFSMKKISRTFIKFVTVQKHEINLTKKVLSNLHNEYTKYVKFNKILISDANKAINKLTDINSETSILSDYNKRKKNCEETIVKLTQKIKELKEKNRDIYNRKNSIIRTSIKRIKELERSLDLTNEELDKLKKRNSDRNLVLLDKVRRLRLCEDKIKEINDMLDLFSKNDKSEFLAINFEDSTEPNSSIQKRIKTTLEELINKDRNTIIEIGTKDRTINDQNDRLIELRNFINDMKTFFAENELIHNTGSLQNLNQTIRDNITNLKTEIRRLIQVNTETNNERKKILKQFKGVFTENIEINAKILDQNSLIEEMTKSNNTLKEEIQKLTDELNEHKDNIKKITEEKNKLEKDKNEEINKCKKANEKLIDSLKTISHALSNKDNTHEYIVQTLREQVDDHEEIKSLKRILSQTLDQLHKLGNEHVIYKNTTIDEIKRLQELIKFSSEEIEKLKKTNTNLETRHEQLNDLHKYLNKKYKKLYDENEKNKRNYGLSKKDISVLEERVKSLEQELAQKTQGINIIAPPAIVKDEKCEQELEALKRTLREKSIQIDELNTKIREFINDSSNNYSADLQETIKKVLGLENLDTFKWNTYTKTKLFKKLNERYKQEEILGEKIKGLERSINDLRERLKQSDDQIQILKIKEQELEECKKQHAILRLSNNELLKKNNSICDTLKGIFNINNTNDCDQLLRIIGIKWKEINDLNERNNINIENLSKFYALNIEKMEILKKIRLNNIKLSLLSKDTPQGDVLTNKLRQEIQDLESKLQHINTNISDVENTINASKPGIIHSFQTFFQNLVQTNQLDGVIIENFNNIVSSDVYNAIINDIRTNINEVPEEVLITLLSIINNEILEQRRLIIDIHKKIINQQSDLNMTNSQIIDNLKLLQNINLDDKSTLDILAGILTGIDSINKSFNDISVKSIRLYKDLMDKLDSEKQLIPVTEVKKLLTELDTNKSLEKSVLSGFVIQSILSSDEFKKCIDYLSQCTLHRDALDKLHKQLVSLIEQSKSSNDVGNFDTQNTDEIIGVITKLIDKLTIISSINFNKGNKFNSYFISLQNLYDIDSNLKDSLDKKKMRYDDLIDEYKKTNKAISRETDKTVLQQLKSNLESIIEELHRLENDILSYQTQIIIETKRRLLELEKEDNTSDISGIQNLDFDTQSVDSSTSGVDYEKLYRELLVKCKSLRAFINRHHSDYDSGRNTLVSSMTESLGQILPTQTIETSSNDQGEHVHVPDIQAIEINNSIYEYAVIIADSFLTIVEFLIKQVPDNEQFKYKKFVDNVKENITFFKQNKEQITKNNATILTMNIQRLINSIQTLILEIIRPAIQSNIKVIEMIKASNIQELIDDIDSFQTSINIVSNYLPMFKSLQADKLTILEEKISDIKILYPTIINALKDCLSSKEKEFKNLNQQIAELTRQNKALRDSNNEIQQKEKECLKLYNELKDQKDKIEDELIKLKNNSVPIEHYKKLEKAQNECEQKMTRLEEINRELTGKIEQQNLQNLSDISTKGNIQGLDAINSEFIINYSADLVINIFINTLIDVNNNIDKDSQFVNEDGQTDIGILDHFNSLPILYAIGIDESVMFNIIIQYLKNPFKIEAIDPQINNKHFINHINYLINKLGIKSNYIDQKTSLETLLQVSDNITDTPSLFSNFHQTQINKIKDSPNLENEKENYSKQFKNVSQQLFKKLIIDSELSGKRSQDILIGGISKTQLKQLFDNYNNEIMFKNTDTRELQDSISKLNKGMDTDYQMIINLYAIIKNNLENIQNEDLKRTIIASLINFNNTNDSMYNFDYLFNLNNLVILKSQFFTENLFNEIEIFDKVTLPMFLLNIFIILTKNILYFMKFNIDISEEYLIKIFRIKIENITPLYLHIVKSNKSKLLYMYKDIGQISESALNNVLNK